MCLTLGSQLIFSTRKYASRKEASFVVAKSEGMVKFPGTLILATCWDVRLWVGPVLPAVCTECSRPLSRLA